LCAGGILNLEGTTSKANALMTSYRCCMVWMS